MNINDCEYKYIMTVMIMCVCVRNAWMCSVIHGSPQTFFAQERKYCTHRFPKLKDVIMSDVIHLFSHNMRTIIFTATAQIHRTTHNYTKYTEIHRTYTKCTKIHKYAETHKDMQIHINTQMYTQILKNTYDCNE